MTDHTGGSDLRAYGLAGVDSHDGPRAVLAWRRIRWVQGALSLCAIPAFYAELTVPGQMALGISRALYLLLAIGFAFSLGRLAYLSRRPTILLGRNWIDLLIVAGSVCSVSFGTPPWQTVEWVLRLAFMSILALRILLSLLVSFAPNRLMLLLLSGAVVLALAGAGFYWIEPRVHSYAEGLWLAFESSATVGYGDIAPTTPASRVFAAFVVLLGYGMLSLVFASIAAAFVGKEERALRREMHRDIKRLNEELVRIRHELAGLRATLQQESCQGEADKRVITRSNPQN